MRNEHITHKHFKTQHTHTCHKLPAKGNARHPCSINITNISHTVRSHNSTPARGLRAGCMSCILRSTVKESKPVSVIWNCPSLIFLTKANPHNVSKTGDASCCNLSVTRKMQQGPDEWSVTYTRAYIITNIKTDMHTQIKIFGESLGTRQRSP